MGFDVFTTKCPHNRVLRRLETCPQCVDQARAQAVAKAGPQMYRDGSLSDHWLDRLQAEGIHNRSTDEVELSGCVVRGADFRRSMRLREERVHPGVPHVHIENKTTVHVDHRDRQYKRSAFRSDLQPVTPAGKWQKLMDECQMLDQWVNAGFVSHSSATEMKRAKLAEACVPEVPEPAEALVPYIRRADCD